MTTVPPLELELELMLMLELELAAADAELLTSVLEAALELESVLTAALDEAAAELDASAPELELVLELMAALELMLDDTVELALVPELELVLMETLDELVMVPVELETAADELVMATLEPEVTPEEVPEELDVAELVPATELEVPLELLSDEDVVPELAWPDEELCATTIRHCPCTQVRPASQSAVVSQRGSSPPGNAAVATQPRMYVPHHAAIRILRCRIMERAPFGKPTLKLADFRKNVKDPLRNEGSLSWSRGRPSTDAPSCLQKQKTPEGVFCLP